MVFVDRTKAGIETLHIISARKERNMSKACTRTSSVKRIEISDETRRTYADRDKSLDHADPDAPAMPPEFWANATVGKYYGPVKTQILLRIDNEVLDGLKSKGRGHLSRINEILRERMTRERQ